MAIDFDKIWASTSPLTPYEFTEDNYKSGWNFIGSTPPSRQMWDFLQKQNDEKAQLLNNNKLSLSGGTMTGSIVFSSGNVKRETDDSALGLYGGSEFGNGAVFQAFGKDNGTYPGWFSLRADDGVNNKLLIGKPDGTLTWGSKTIIVGTEVSETFSNQVVNASGYVSVDLAHAPKYCSVSLNGTNAQRVTSQVQGQKLYFVNGGTNNATITATIKYIY